MQLRMLAYADVCSCVQASRKESAELQLQRCAHLRTQLEAELQVLLTKPLLTKPLLTKPLLTKPLLTKPLLTKPLLTKPLCSCCAHLDTQLEAELQVLTSVDVC
jgi:hypothetical protein